MGSERNNYECVICADEEMGQFEHICRSISGGFNWLCTAVDEEDVKAVAELMREEDWRVSIIECRKVFYLAYEDQNADFEHARSFAEGAMFMRLKMQREAVR